MYETTKNAALTMRWTLETDASGRTRPAAHWVAAQPALADARTTAVQAA